MTRVKKMVAQRFWEAGVLMYSASKDELMELVKKTMEADSE